MNFFIEECFLAMCFAWLKMLNVDGKGQGRENKRADEMIDYWDDFEELLACV